jgi:hypothetical protein
VNCGHTIAENTRTLRQTIAAALPPIVITNPGEIGPNWIREAFLRGGAQ